MGKHVCPVCEDVYAVPTDVVMMSSDRRLDLEGWGCPSCGYVFLELADAAVAAEKLGEIPVEHHAKMRASEVRFRER